MTSRLMDRSSRGRWGIFLSAAVLLSFCSLLAFGQEADAPPEKTPAADSAVEADKPEVSVAAAERIVVELDEPEKQPGISERVDGAFGYAVDKMLNVLFFRFFATDETYIETAQFETYMRARDSKDDFVRVDPPSPATKMTLAEAKSLQARGKLVIADAQRPYRLGKAAGKKVDYVTVVVDSGATYVSQAGKNKDDQVFVKTLSKRQLLSDKEEDRLTLAEVNERGKKGWLKTKSEEQVKENPKLAPYVLTRETGGAPVVVLWLALGSIFFTIYMRGVNIWAFTHAIAIVWGKYDNPKETGEVSHFQALSSALSATVGLGNIAGVTIAMTAGGPGAFFWMLACGAFGMTSKFTECTLGQKYRRVKEDGTILGGPMQYLHEGLKGLGLGQVGFVLSIVFAVMCVLASFGGGNMFQANQSGATMLTMVQQADRAEMEKLNNSITDAAEKQDHAELESLQKDHVALQAKMDSFGKIFKSIFGVLFAASVAVVIIGGIKRIAAAAEKVVPTMCGLYMLACLWIIGSHFAELPALIASIFTEAFSPQAFGGGMLGVLVVGVQRAAFSNEAGVGSAAIAHSAAKTEEPVREGIVALLGPFIDTIMVCSMTALVILITGAWDNDTWTGTEGLSGAALTSRAFGAEIWWFPYVLSIAVVLFAYSTIISWSYYGERCWERLFGPRSIVFYRIIYVGCVFVGAIVNLGAVLDFSDMMILSMAFPNIFGVLLLCPQVRRDLLDYWRRYKAGEFKTFK